MATYLITGVAGFIGSHLADALVAAGEAVRGIDNFSTGKRSNLAGIEDRIDVREVDVRDAAGVAEACLGVEYVLHEAALPSVPRSVKDPRTSHESNVDGTFNLLEGARAAGVKRVVYAASSSAYGNQPGFPRVETMAPQPIAPYPVQKLRGRALHAVVLGGVWAGDGVPAVLQHLRAAAGAGLALLRRDGEVLPADAEGRAAGDPRRWRAGAGLYLYRQRRARRTCWPRAPLRTSVRGGCSTWRAGSGTR